MKSKFSKILGVGLALALVLALCVAFVPNAGADPGELEWSKMSFPKVGADGDYFRDADIDGLGPMDIAIDGTLYAYVHLLDGSDKLMKSDDDGRIWSATKYTGGAIVDIATSSEDADILYVVDNSNDIYKTTNAGSSFSKLSGLTLDTEEGITSIDVGYVDGASYVFVGTSIGIGHDFGLNIDGVSITLTPGDTVEEIATKIAAVVTGSGVADAVADGNVVNFTARVPGDAGNITVTTVDDDFSYDTGTVSSPITLTGGLDAVAQIDTVTPVPAADATYILTISGIPFTHTSVGLETDVVIADALIALVNADGVPVAATGENSGTIILTADVAGTAFITGSTGTGELTIVHTEANVVETTATGTATVSGDAILPTYGDVHSLDESTYGAGWQDLGLNRDVVHDVRCSPNFATEANPQLVAVASDGFSTYVSYKYGGAIWGDTVDRVLLGNFVAEGADIAFPDDYDSDAESGQLEFFVAIDDAADPTVDGGIYRIVVDNQWNTTETLDLDFASLDIAGNVGACFLMAGTTDGKVYWSDDGTGSAWSLTRDAPTGDGNAYVILTSDFLDSDEAWALVDIGEQALSWTEDGGVSWNQISLIDTDIDSVNDLAFSSDRFMATTGTDGGSDSLWRYDGTYWERVACAANIDLVQCSPNYESDSTLFWADQATNQIYRSTDDGQRFSEQLSAAPSLTGWVVIDNLTIIVGGPHVTHKTTNNGSTWGSAKDCGTSGNVISFALSPAFDDDETILLGKSNGDVYKSTDAGGKWSVVSTPGLVGDTYVAFDPGYADNETIYAAAGDTVARYTTKWEDILTETITAATGLVCSADGTLYATDGTAAGMMRTLAPTASTETKCDWENVIKDITVSLDALFLTAGSNMLWGYEGTTVWTYEDTLTGSPALKSPADGSSSGRQTSASVSWEELDGAKAYEVRCNTRSDFKGVEVTVEDVSVPATDITGDTTGLNPGSTYYWKVRVAGGEPVLSRWSEVWSFTTAMGEAQWNPFTEPSGVGPSAGATDVPLRPAFQWNAADWATSYEFVLADNAAFTSPIVSETVTDTIFALGEDLEYSTSYSWKVRAVSDTGESNWGTGVFTTMAKPVAPTPPVEVTPAPPAPVLPTPETPVYVWAIIGIGAVLVIALIVLIVRTRRVA